MSDNWGELWKVDVSTFICCAMRTKWSTRTDRLAKQVCGPHLRASVLMGMTSAARKSRALPIFTWLDSLQTQKKSVMLRRGKAKVTPRPRNRKKKDVDPLLIKR